ncbi:hypothetical protein Slin15195_G105800 [Septoria linicola]|uniref:Sequence orphan n=1 Tax=Septoria linicola TaxID=215465 RepID=A0A9Q9B503_9PEZI|nr:hypothetical protein Slin15195_G105800 [Septoria linicola]
MDVKQQSEPDTKSHQASTESWTHCNDLLGRLAVDAASAMAAAVAVSPVMTIIDRAVVAAAATQSSALLNMRLAAKDALRHPGTFLSSRPLRLMTLLYFGTYSVANGMDTANSYAESLPASTTTSNTSKFAAVTVINLGLYLYKDNCLAQTFGPKTKFLRPLPASSFVPFLLRDGITLFFTFDVPALASDNLPESIEQYISRLSVLQLAAPVASQLLATPLHLYGLDLYNRPGKLSMRDRFAIVRRTWLSAFAARACRIIPAYGIGGVLNNDVRAMMMRRHEKNLA